MIAKNLTFAFLGTWNTIKCCFAPEILQLSVEIASCKPLAGIELHLEKFSSVDITERKMWLTWKEILKDYGLVFGCQSKIKPLLVPNCLVNFKEGFLKSFFIKICLSTF